VLLFDLAQDARDWTVLTAVKAATTAAERIAAAETLVTVAVCHAGDRDVAVGDLAPLKRYGKPVADVIGPIPYVALQRMFDARAPRGMRSYTKTAYADAVDGQLIGILLRHAEQLRELHPFSTVHLHHLGGAASRVAVDATAFPHRGHTFVFNVIAGWQDPAQDPAHLEWANRVSGDLSAFAPDAQFVNFLSDTTQDKVRAAFGESTYRRLAELKGRYDPTNLFRFNLNLPALT
jgi:FAD/FMN-containing dehydrogenase